MHRRTVRETFDAIHSPVDREWHWRPIVALLLAAVCLALLNYLTHTPFAGLASPDFAGERRGAERVLGGLPGTVLFRTAGNDRRSEGGRLSDYGLSIQGSANMCHFMVVVWRDVAVDCRRVVYSGVSELLSLLRVRRPVAGGFLLWESMYAVQFVVLEFFFRGFLLFSLARYIGVYAVFVMVIPYCMVHFGKPFAEVLAAIPAGVLLGYLALKTRSIWLGAALHIAVAWTMDVLSLAQRGADHAIVGRAAVKLHTPCAELLHMKLW